MDARKVFHLPPDSRELIHLIRPYKPDKVGNSNEYINIATDPKKVIFPFWLWKMNLSFFWHMGRMNGSKLAFWMYEESDKGLIYLDTSIYTCHLGSIQRWEMSETRSKATMGTHKVEALPQKRSQPFYCKLLQAFLQTLSLFQSPSLHVRSFHF